MHRTQHRTHRPVPPTRTRRALGGAGARALAGAAVLTAASGATARAAPSGDPVAPRGGEALRPIAWVEADGVLSRAGITGYMYGTHVLAEGPQGPPLYALRRAALDLDRFVGRPVRVFGIRVAGYPVDSGPLYLEAKRVEVLA